MFYRDYEHRKRVVDIHIGLRTAFERAGGKVLSYDNYFDTKKVNNYSNNREVFTKIRTKH